MKKCTTFQFIVSLCMIVTLHVNAMEIMQDPSIPNNDICYLVIMLPEILHYIEQFLMWESQEKFIERIRLPQIAPEKYYKLFTSNGRCFAGAGDGSSVAISGVFCPDKTKIALFELLCGTCVEPKLMIVDVQKEKEDYDGKLDSGCYRAIGLSRSGHMIAVIQKQPISDNNCRETVGKDVLVIQKIDMETMAAMKEVRKFDIPDCFVPLSINFNKQGTHVAVRGNYSELNSESRIIFSLKNKIDGFELKNAITDKNHLLQEYFRHKCICKNILRIT